MSTKTTKEQIEYLSSQEKQKLAYEALKEAVQVISLEKNRSISTNTYSRDNLRSYLRAPSTESNQKSLRALSDYLYNISHIYRRMVNYKAEQITCKAWTAYPLVSISEENDEEKIKQDYEKVTRIVTNMHMETQILKLMVRAWKHDVAYGYTYGDPEGDEGFYIHLLDPDYCRIYGADFNSGVLYVAFDMSYFRTYPDDLEYFDKEFQKLYNQYQKDNIKWKPLPIERTIAIKINIDNLLYPLLPFSGLLEEIINIEDLQSIQNAVDELQAYKLIWAKIPTISGTNQVDDFAIDLNLANEFYKKLLDIIPDGVNIAMTPMDLETIDFTKNSAADDTNTLNKAYQNLIETNGSIVLNSNKITNSESFKKAMMVECLDAMKPIEQINAWLNLYLKNNFGIENFIVEFSDVSPYFVGDRIDQLLKMAQYGLPVKLELASLNKMTPMKERGMSYMEELLGLGATQWNKPLVSSNVQSGNPENGDGSEGAPTKDDSEISADGVASRDKK